jgi:hypothetical protein
MIIEYRKLRRLGLHHVRQVRQMARKGLADPVMIKKAQRELAADRREFLR